MMTIRGVYILITVLAALPAGAERTVYVPYEDLASVIDPATKAVLMDREAFEKLLAEAKARGELDRPTAAEISRAEYSANVAGRRLTLSGTLTVVTSGDGPMVVGLGFGGMGITRAELDGGPAPLSVDQQGRLVLIVQGTGEHRLTVAGSAQLEDLKTGGMQFGLSLPPAVSGTMRLTAEGDVSIDATVPAQVVYDPEKDRTRAELTIGGQASVTAVLTGNGRQDADRAIVIGTSTTTVTVGTSDQIMQARHTVQVLRRGVRRLRFALPIGWTVTAVTCPQLLRWSVTENVLIAELRGAVRGTATVGIEATAVGKEHARWTGPRVSLVDADFQRGWLVVRAEKGLRVRRERLVSARREDAGTVKGASGRVYYHWGDQWSVGLELAAVAVRTGSEQWQTIRISEDHVTIDGRFRVTALGGELFDLAFGVPAEAAGWFLTSVTVNGGTDGFAYRVQPTKAGRTVRIALARPVAAEEAVDVAIRLRRVPASWDWSGSTKERRIAVPLIRSHADSVSGRLAVVTEGDLDGSPASVPQALTPVSAARMADLGFGEEVRLAYRYARPGDGELALTVSRREARLGAESVGLVGVTPTKLTGHWRITYTITRARTKRLHVAVDERLGSQFEIEAVGRRLASKNVVPPDAMPAPAGYRVWRLVLDEPTDGQVHVRVRYDRPVPGARFTVPLVRAVAVSRSEEFVAVEAGQELALTVNSTGASVLDAADLPGLPAEAGRIVSAMRLAGLATPKGAAASVTLSTTVHNPYAIPSAVAVRAELTTHVGPQGRQRTQATFRLVNAGLQFLPLRLAEEAELWSVRVGDEQARPRRDAEGQYLVALPRGSDPVAVRIVYAWPVRARSMNRIEVKGVDLPGVVINHVQWQVVAPPGFQVTGQETTMNTTDVSPPTPAYVDAGRMVGGFFRKFGGFPGILRLPSLARARESAKRVSWQDDEGIPAAAPLDAPVEETDRAMMKATPESQTEMPQQRAGVAVGRRFVAKGRYTLPVELSALGGERPWVRFSGMGRGELVVGMRAVSRTSGWWWLGFVAIVATGLAMIRIGGRRKSVFLFGVLAGASLVAIWCPWATHVANGAFFGGIAMIHVYPLVALVRCIRLPRRRLGAAGLIAAMAISAGSAYASEGDGRIVVPYEGDPATAVESGKVLVPYGRFVQLWNRVHPEDRIDVPTSATRAALGNVRYEAVVAGEGMNVELTAAVQTFGTGAVVLPMPMSGLAVVQATLDDKPARLQMGPKGMVLVLDGGASGTLRITAVTTVKQSGRKGHVKLALPPMPAAVMTVQLPDKELVLDAGEIAGTVDRKESAQGVRWTFPLGTSRTVSLRWSPPTGTGAADRTLSATMQHDVRMFHWAISGTSKAVFRFSAGERDRFALLVPEWATLAAVTGANVRDHRVVGRQSVDGRTFRVVEIRLHRPATSEQDVTAEWLGPLPAAGKPTSLLVPRAADVARESGSLSLYAAGGMTVNVQQVVGGRRQDGSPTAAGTSAESTVKVAGYAWPYRPFSMSVAVSREDVAVAARTDQLVRITRDSVQLLAAVQLTARKGQLFGATMSLPKGYELLSVLGPAVADHYVQTTTDGSRLHVGFVSASKQADVSVVLVRENVDVGHLRVPMMAVVDPEGRALADQRGRLAVQVAAALEAQTVDRAKLKALRPQTLAGWLDKEQLAAVRFAYGYESADGSLVLQIRPQPTRVRSEVIAGVTVRPAAALYAYRLRYEIEGSPVDRVSFTLPKQYERLATVSSPAMRSVERTDAGADRTRWTVMLIHEVTGTVDVNIEFAVPIEWSTRALPVPSVDTGTEAGYRAIVAVQNFSRRDVQIAEATHLTDVPVSEQKRLLADSVRRWLRYVKGGFKADWTLTLSLTPPRATAARVQAVVDLLAITTVMDRRGRCRYDVTLTLQNRSEQFLTVTLPTGATLWSAYVAGRPVKPVVQAGQPADRVMIPLVKTSPGGLPYAVKLYLADDSGTGLDGVTRLSLPAVDVVGMPVMRTTWSVRLPSGYRYCRWSGNMSAIAGRAEAISIASETLIEQSKRLAEYGQQEYSDEIRQRAVSNLMQTEQALKANIDENRRYIARYRGKMDADTYGRLKQQIDRQHSYQKGLKLQVDKLESARQDQRAGGLAKHLRETGGGAGLAENKRDIALGMVPGFVQRPAGPVERVPGKAGAATDRKKQSRRLHAYFGARRNGRQDGKRVRPQPQRQSAPQAVIAGEPVVRRGVDVVRTSYVPTGTFSLPVSLPEGGVRFDFARPAGQASLTVWAVRRDLIASTQATVTVVVLLALIAVVMRLLRRLTWSRTRISGKTLAGYVLLAVLFFLLIGVVGIALGVLVAAICEYYFRTRPTDGPTTDNPT